MMTEPSIWKSEVRDYEVDYQGIVNNANYFHYLDHARAKVLESFGINIASCALEKKNMVLLKTGIIFKKSLVYGNAFSVCSKMKRISRFKFTFEQKIFSELDQQLIVVADSLVACIDERGKPYLLKQLEHMEITGS